MIWFGLAKMALKTGAEVYKNRQETKQLESLAAKNQMAKMAAGELEYKAQVLKSNDQGIKDDIVLLIVILPIVILAWSIFSGDDQAKEKLDLFFHYFNNFPEFYKWLILGIFGSIYGLKPGMDLVRNRKNGKA
jgi:hypothetical protein|tara:strand:- start:152 stop:550 length:399 start_codon:yes stop_codon:yes gene_type:complete